jgi:hypothetical protein
MKLSAPLYHLKRKAKLLSRAENIPLHEALDRVARQEVLSGWSLLAAKVTASAPPKNCLHGWLRATWCWWVPDRAKAKP